MARNKYRLQTVLDARDRARQDAARALAARRAQLLEAEVEQARREEALALCRSRQLAAQAEMMAEATKGAEAGQLVVHRTHLADLRTSEQQLIAALEQQKALVAHLEYEADKALTVLIEASKELQVMKKHREGWRRQARQEEARREQKLNDEISAIRHNRQG
jgi:flagellar export protein FliJ